MVEAEEASEGGGAEGEENGWLYARTTGDETKQDHALTNDAMAVLESFT